LFCYWIIDSGEIKIFKNRDAQKKRTSHKAVESVLMQQIAKQYRMIQKQQKAAQNFKFYRQ